MNCADFEKLIALDVEGDLPKEKAACVAAHLSTCSPCREFREKLQASQALLKDFALEAPDEATLQGVRRSILSRLPAEVPPMPFPRWRLALGAGLVALLILAALMLRRPMRTPAPAVGGKTEAPRALEAARQTLTPIVSTPSRKRVRIARARNFQSVSPRGSETWQHAEPLTVKLITDNPNIVIYWQVD